MKLTAILISFMISTLIFRYLLGLNTVDSVQLSLLAIIITKLLEQDKNEPI